MWNFVFEDLSEIIFRNQVLNFEYINSSKTKELRNLIKFIKRNLLQLFYSCMTFVRKFQIKSQFNSVTFYIAVKESFFQFYNF